MASSEYYLKKLSGFSQEVDDALVSPMFYQPTPEGVALLCTHYSQKYSIDLRMFDFRGHVEVPDNCFYMFKHFQECGVLDTLKDNSLTGFVFSHGQFHAIPVVVVKQEGKISIACFDSTSGSRTKGYFRIANLFPEANFYLNCGTRQADSSSCITDAICVLKEALQLENLFKLIEAKKLVEHSSLASQTRFFSALPQPKTFTLFHMPEQLMLTAQLSKYLTNEEVASDLSVLLRGGMTLGESREHFRMQVSLTQGETIAVTGINSYLFKKSQQHKHWFDQYEQSLKAAKEIADTDVVEAKPSSPKP